MIRGWNRWLRETNLMRVISLNECTVMHFIGLFNHFTHYSSNTTNKHRFKIAFTCLFRKVLCDGILRFSLQWTLQWGKTSLDKVFLVSSVPWKNKSQMFVCLRSISMSRIVFYELCLYRVQCFVVYCCLSASCFT